MYYHRVTDAQVERATKSRTEFKAGSSIDQNSNQAILFDCQNHAFEYIDVSRLLDTKANTIVGFSDDDSRQRSPRLIQLVLNYSFYWGTTEIETGALSLASSRHRWL